MTDAVAFCNRCGAALEPEDEVCRCCGEQTLEANVVTLLKRTSARRTRAGRERDAREDQLPL